MDFEWDEAKARSNLRKHAVSLETAARALLDPDAVITHDADEWREERWRLIGAAHNQELLLVIFTDRGDEQREIARVISARQADRGERLIYERNTMGKVHP